MIVKIHRKVKVHRIPRRIAERRRKRELHRMVEALDARLCGDAKSHLRLLLAVTSG